MSIVFVFFFLLFKVIFFCCCGWLLTVINKEDSTISMNSFFPSWKYNKHILIFLFACLFFLGKLPSGNGPKLSSGGRVWLGIGLARPVRGSIHDVFFSLWSMKNIRPFGATCIVQPLGSPASILFAVCELSLVDVSSLELCLDWPVVVDAFVERAVVFAEPLSAVSTSSIF